MDTQILRPVQSKIVHIRSKDGNQLTSGYNSNFTINLQDPIQIEQGEEIHITMSSGEFPYSFYNVSAEVNNNTIIYNDGAEKSFVFPSKNYDIFKLRDTITDDTGFPFTATFDEYTMKLTLTNTSVGSITLNWTHADTTADKLMGFDDTADDIVASSASTSSDYVVNLCSVHSLLIRSNIATGNVQSSLNSNSTILQKVSIDVNGFNMIYLNQDDFRTTTITQAQTIDMIEFEITDQNRKLIQFNNVNYEMSLIFNVFDRPIHIHTQRRRNNIQRLRSGIPQALPPSSFAIRPLMQVAPTPYMPPPQQTTAILSEGYIDHTDPILNKTKLETVAEETILDQLLDMSK